MLNLKVFALDDGDGEARDGLIEADGEEDLGPLGRLRRLDVALEVGMEVELARGEVEVLHAEEGLTDDAVLPVHVDVVHEQPEGPRVDRQRGRLKNGYLLCSALSLSSIICRPKRLASIVEAAEVPVSLGKPFSLPRQ